MGEGRKADTPGAVVFTFGKYKGMTLAEALSRDQGYCDWLTQQSWFSARFSELHSAILARGAGADDSPEHNLIQARFLMPTFRAAFLLVAGGYSEPEVVDWLRRYTIGEIEIIIEELEVFIRNSTDIYPVSNTIQAKTARLALDILRRELEDPACSIRFESTVEFEKFGVDALISGWFEFQTNSGPECKTMTSRIFGKYIGTSMGLGSYNVEIKPSMGDDFPAVMRQVSRLNDNPRLGRFSESPKPVVLVGRFAMSVLSENQVREMFKRSSIKIVTIDEVETIIRTSRYLNHMD